MKITSNILSLRILGIAAVALAIIAAACSLPDGPGEAGGTIKLNFGKAARAAYPPDQEMLAKLSYTVELRGRASINAGPTAPGTQTINIKAPAGKYTVTVTAWLEGEVYAKGSSEVNLRAGKTATVTIKLTAEGGIEVEVTEGETPDDEEPVDGKYHITMQVEGSGAATANPNPAAEGDNVTITATPETGWGFEEWQVVSGGVTLTHSGANPAEFTMPGGAVTIKAVFFQIPPNTPYLTLEPPTFDEVTFGYSAQDAKNVTITNKGTGTANVTGITLDADGNGAFEIGGLSTSAIEINGTATFTVQPILGLSVGTHRGDITVSYNGKTAETTVSFTVNNADASLLEVKTAIAPTATTATLTLTFDKAIAGLNADDITISKSDSSRLNGTLSGSGPSYTLYVSGFSANETYTMSVTKTGYNISGSPMPVTVYISFTNIATFKTWLEAQPGNDASHPYNVKVDVTTLNGESSTTGSLGNALYVNRNNNKYVNLDLSGSNLTQVNVMQNAFEGCTNLTGITIPNSITSIARGFIGCTGLTSVTIPNNITSIASAFSGCTGLISVTLPNNASFTSIDSAFSGCTSLTSITIPASVTSIGDYAFSSCTGFTSITIPDNVTSIGTYAFAACSNLTGITIPDRVTSIGTYAFQNCTSLTSITIPNSVTSIGSVAFFGCTNLNSVTLPDNPSFTRIEVGAFMNCTSLTRITIPNSVTSIGGGASSNGAFRNTGLTSVTIPASVSSIEESAFQSCNNLTSVRFERAGTTLGYSAFVSGNNTTSLQSAYTSGGIGTYTRPDTTSTTWTRVSG